MMPGIRVWLSRTGAWTPRAAARCEAWLDAGERRRLDGYAFARDRHTYLVAHGLLRWALSQARPGAPSAWSFATTGLGWPQVAGPHRDLVFSLSHTRGLVAVAVSAGGAVGIDAEAIREPGDIALTTAAEGFAGAEQAWIARMPQPARMMARLRLWTLKEAYAKARGLGLSLPLDHSCFCLDGRRGVARFHPPADDRAGVWRFQEGRIAGCRVALACGGGSDREGPVHVAAVAPDFSSTSIVLRLAPV